MLQCEIHIIHKKGNINGDKKISISIYKPVDHSNNRMTRQRPTNLHQTMVQNHDYDDDDLLGQ